MIAITQEPLRSHDGLSLGWWRVQSTARRAAAPRHCLLTHGTFSDRRVCLDAARAWAERGHVAWVMEWRGHGGSQGPSEPWDFETVALKDVDAALVRLRELAAPGTLRAMTHSGGGLALVMAMLRNPERQALLGRMALFACQACDVGRDPWRNTGLRCASALSRVSGGIRARRLRLGVQDETHATMAPWFRWNITGRFDGRDGFDYGARLGEIAVPVMAVAGARDRFIAPADACERFLRRFGSLENDFILCGRATGFERDHTHASVIHSTEARTKVIPRVVGWLEAD